jgi:uncharacterized protein (TIGR02270 family)
MVMRGMSCPSHDDLANDHFNKRRLSGMRSAIQAVVAQHADDAVALATVRSSLLRSPHVQLHRLMRLDERIAGHLDGLAVAGPSGKLLLQAQLDRPTKGGVFVLAWLALQAHEAEQLTQLATLAATLPEAERGFLSALGWVSAEDLQGTVRALLGSQAAIHRAWGLAACAMHRVDPGPILTQASHDANPLVRTRAWRVAGQCGRRDLANAARLTLARNPAATSEAEAAPDLLDERRAAAWALTLFGEGQNELVRQTLLAPEPGQTLPCQDAHRLATIAAPLDWGRDQVRALAATAETSPPHKRRMMRLAGWVGDVQVIPWLIQHMSDDVWARLAGEAFSLITGADLALLDIERKPPEGIDFGPNADPEDENVAMDEDDSLPWPDQAKVQAWWQANAHRFTAGQRYFAGEPPSPAHCIHVLKTKGQRQRTQAAEYLCLLRPGSKLFPVAAPAWRQQRWLSEEAKALGLAA